MKDFFISYTGADQQWAEWIAWQLESAGYSVLIQAWDFRPGSNFVLEMQRAASEAERTIAVLSPNFLAARFTQPEWAAAFAQDPTGEKGTLVPVRIRECGVEGLLRGIVYIDLVGADEAAAKQKLLAGTQRGRAKPTTAPAFPARVGGTTGGATPPLRFPGAMPAIWNLPFLRNPNFTGRAELLQQLRAALTSGAPSTALRVTALTQAIHGLGGVGKTQLAVEYAYRFAADYDIVWFVRAETTASIASDLALLAQPLQLPERDARDQNIVVQAVRDYLRQHERWLVILDNAEEPKNVRPFLPSGRGHVLITSRNHAWRGIANPLLIETMPRDEAIDFLLKRTGDTDRDTANILAGALGDLPLALEQAGAYIEACKLPLTKYLEMFATHHVELLKCSKPLDYPNTVATTWDISFKKVMEESPAAVQLLNLCAFFAANAIPRYLISGTFVMTRGTRTEVIVHAHEKVSLPLPLADVVKDEYELSKAEAVLLRYSLIDKSNEVISIHRLVQQIARDKMSDEDRKAFAEAAMKIMRDELPSFASPSLASRLTFGLEQLLPHILATTEYAIELRLDPETITEILSHFAVYLEEQARFQDAKLLIERSLQFTESTFGIDHPRTAVHLNNLGSLLMNQGDSESASKYFVRALKINVAALGPNHPDVAPMFNNLGMALKNLGDLEGARECYQHALKIYQSATETDQGNVAKTHNNLGVVLRTLGDLAGARQHFERALTIGETAFGTNHPQFATFINNYGSLLNARGDPEGARECYTRALMIDEAAFGPNHPDVARDANNLGLVLYALGNLEGARMCFEHALKICIAFFGEKHPNTIGVQEHLKVVEKQVHGRV